MTETSLVRPAPDGFPLAVQVSGPEDAPALLLLAGQANSHVWWRNLRGFFESRFRVITFDYRGTGGSRGQVGSWSTRLFAADAAHVLGAVGIGSAAVYGTSMGGRVAQMLAIDRPDLVDRLVLACTSPGGTHAYEGSSKVRRALADPDLDRRRRTLHQLFYTDSWPFGADQSTLLGDDTMTPAERRAHLRASATHDAWDALPGVSVPTLVLHGSADLIVPVDNVELIASRIPGAEVFVHRDGRHGFFEEFHQTVSTCVLAFLATATNPR